MTMLREKLTEAINAKNNDVKSFVWKFAKNSEGVQNEIRLIDATEEQLKQFYGHCMSMLYNDDKNNPGRYPLLDIIKDQRNRCNIELFLRKLDNGELCADGKSYPRHLYIQDIRAYMNMNRESFPSDKLKEISISSITGGLPREYARISISDAMDGGLDQLGIFNNKHITFNFILNMGVCLTPEELKEFTSKDKDGNPRSKLELVRERLGMKDNIRLIVKPSGLTYSELRAMVNLRPKKYRDLTTDQLVVLRNKVLFRLENEVMFHIEQWEERIRQIKLVAEAKGITLPD